MINIKINKREFILKFSDSSYDLYEKMIAKEGKNIGKEREQLIGYFSDLNQLYKHLVKLKLSSSNIKSFEDMLKAVNQMSEQLESLLTYKGDKQ